MYSNGIKNINTNELSMEVRRIRYLKRLHRTKNCFQFSPLEMGQQFNISREAASQKKILRKPDQRVPTVIADIETVFISSL